MEVEGGRDGRDEDMGAVLRIKEDREKSEC